jgi:hypothetical protein
MKLLFCLDCCDIVKLIHTERTCSCGKSKGMYIDNINATYSGNAKLLGFNNTSFAIAVREQNKRDESRLKSSLADFLYANSGGIEFIAFIIPEDAKSINKTDR